MKKLITLKNQSGLYAIGTVFLTLTLLFASSCNKDFPNTLRSEYPNDTANVALKEKKVLYIFLDGVRGNAIKTLNPPNLAQIVRKSIYTYDGLTDFTSSPITNASGWTTALTSVTSTQHQVVSENFAGNQVMNFPTLFTRFKQINPKLRTASIVASKSINDFLAVDATFKANFENDDQKVKDATIAELKNQNASIVLAQFHSAELAGAANSYTDTSIPYTNAITQLDTYVGELMTALNARANISKEDWLIVIASNKGGTIAGSTGVGAFADAAKNSFIAFYNPRFGTQITPKPDVNSLPYTGSAPNFTGNNALSTNAKLGNNTLGNFGANGEYTFVCKFRNDGDASNYPSVISKRASFSIGTPGWLLFLENDIIQLNIGQIGLSNAQVSFGKVRDAIWHSLAFKIWNNAGVRTATVFLDGIKGASINISAYGNFDSPAPFTLGGNFLANESGTINVLIKDIAMFNTAISDVNLANNMKKAEIAPDYPNYSSLVGNWPAGEGSGTIIRDVSGKAPNFTTSANVNWKAFTDSSPNVSPSISDATYTVVINSVDITFEIYQWMGVIVPSSWMLKGKTWKPTYTDVRNN